MAVSRANLPKENPELKRRRERGRKLSRFVSPRSSQKLNFENVKTLAAPFSDKGRVATCLVTFPVTGRGIISQIFRWFFSPSASALLGAPPIDFRIREISSHFSDSLTFQLRLLPRHSFAEWRPSFHPSSHVFILEAEGAPFFVSRSDLTDFNYFDLKGNARCSFASVNSRLGCCFRNQRQCQYEKKNIAFPFKTRLKGNEMHFSRQDTINLSYSVA